MGTYDKVSPGIPFGQSPAFRSAWLNGVSEAAANFQERKANGDTGGDRRALFNSSGLIDVKNRTEGDLLRGHYVQLGEYLYDYSTDDDPLAKIKHTALGFRGNLYDSGNSGRVAIYISAVKVDKTAKARLIGVCTAIVNVTSTSHRFAAPADGLSVLASASRGTIEIISDVTVTGEQEVAVLMGGGGGGTGEFRYGVIDVAGGPGTPDIPDNGTEVTLGTDFGGAHITGVLNYNPDTPVFGRACRISYSGDQPVLDWWSCNGV